MEKKVKNIGVHINAGQREVSDSVFVENFADSKVKYNTSWGSQRAKNLKFKSL